MIDPVVIPDGTPMFAGIGKKFDLELIGSKVFKSGVVLVSYRPMHRRASS
jgi:dihydrofolate reductase